MTDSSRDGVIVRFGYSFVIKDSADILSEITSVDVLVSVVGRLWVFVTECTLSRTGSALAVERIAQSTARTVGLEIVSHSLGIDFHIFTQIAESPAHAPCRKVRRHDIVFSENVFETALAKSVSIFSSACPCSERPSRAWR